MKKVYAILLIAPLLLTSRLDAAEVIDGIAEFSAVYDVYRGGLKVAKMTRELSREMGESMLYSETTTTGLVSLFRKDKIIERSVWKTVGGQLRPKIYEYLHTGTKKKRNVTVEFDWDRQLITNSVNGDSWKMPTEAGVLDKLLYQYSIMLDLREGKDELVYRIADGGKEKTYVFETLGEEYIETPLGKLRTIKLKRLRSDSDRQSIFWSAPEMNYLPVKLEIIDDGEKTMVIIDSITGLNTNTALSDL